MAASTLLYNLSLFTSRDESVEMVQLVSGLAHRVHADAALRTSGMAAVEDEVDTGVRLLLALGKAVHRRLTAVTLATPLLALALCYRLSLLHSVPAMDLSLCCCLALLVECCSSITLWLLL